MLYLLHKRIFSEMSKRSYSAEEAAELMMMDSDESDNSLDSLDAAGSESDTDTEGESGLSDADLDDEMDDYSGAAKIRGPPVQASSHGFARGCGTRRGRATYRRRGGRSIRVRGRGISVDSRRPEIQYAAHEDQDEIPENAENEPAPSIITAPASEPDADPAPAPQAPFVWSNAAPVVEEFEFLATPGLTEEPPLDASPVYFFQLYQTEAYLETLAGKVNTYAEAVIGSAPRRRSKKQKAWVPVTVDELRKFQGILLHMGNICMPSYRHYWQTNKFFKMNFFSSIMSRDRFEQILRYYNFGDVPLFDGDRLGKIRFLLDHFNDVSSRVFIPDKNLSLDESMMLWRGRLVFRQYIKNKRHKYGIKFFELCTDDGYILLCRIYAGVPLEDPENLGQTGQYVIDLGSSFFDKGYHFYTDNYYNSAELTQYLNSRKTYITGTLRSDRKQNPKAVKEAKLGKGEMVSQSSGPIVVCKWKDKRDVLCISNAHVPSLVATQNRHGAAKVKPNIVRDYNLHMSGIDRSDQMLSYYSGLRKTIRWYKKIGVHMLEKMVNNAFYLSRLHNPNSVKHIIQMRMMAIEWFIGNTPAPLAPAPTAAIHHLKSFPPTEKKKHPQRICKVCYEKKVRKDTRYFCAKCEQHPALCIEPCFLEYHVRLGLGV